MGDSTDDRVPTLYLSRTGLVEPLAQSQVLPYLKGLSEQYRITLITEERSIDWASTAKAQQLRAVCADYGIVWVPLGVSRGPRAWATVCYVFRIISVVYRLRGRESLSLIHARSYIPAAVGAFLGRRLNIPLVFDMRALWPEELITSGRLQRGSFLHRLLARLERYCLDRASSIITLTNASLAYLHGKYAAEVSGKPVRVIPTCVDLERITPGAGKAAASTVHGCIGTVLSGWFRLDWLSAWIHHVADSDDRAVFEVVTRDDHASVRQSIDPRNHLGKRLRVTSCSPEEVPSIVCGHSLSVMFYAGGEVSELGRSPTRLAEVLACGVPVVGNRGVGDVADIILSERVGVLLEGVEPRHLESALQALEQLMAEPGLKDRCRAVAVKLFSLTSGVAAYEEAYAEVLSPC
jgi:glycosyltransferase involved in cell wall biosynthesis